MSALVLVLPACGAGAKPAPQAANLSTGRRLDENGSRQAAESEAQRLVDSCGPARRGRGGGDGDLSTDPTFAVRNLGGRSTERLLDVEALPVGARKIDIRATCPYVRQAT